jgi:hypothetical protein
MKQSIELGYFGNIWVRQNILSEKGDSFDGHLHAFDHVTLLAKGSLRMQVEGNEPKDFIAPTFIVIAKDKKHQVTALEDETIYYCVFALRNIDGEVVENIYGEQHNPLSASPVNADYFEKSKKIDI